MTERPEPTGRPVPGDRATPGTAQTGEALCPRCGGTGMLPAGVGCPDCAGGGTVLEPVGDA